MMRDRKDHNISCRFVSSFGVLGRKEATVFEGTTVGEEEKKMSDGGITKGQFFPAGEEGKGLTLNWTMTGCDVSFILQLGFALFFL